MDLLFGAADCQNEPTKLFVEVGPNIKVQLNVPEDDFNGDKSTLFATFLWSGSSVLSRKLLDVPDLVAGASVLEFGAAAGLPSIAAAKLGASLVCASDYPSPTVLMTLQKNLTENSADAVAKVVPHKWGEDVDALLAANGHNKYDLVLAAECLWKHDAHESLVASIKGCIKPGGVLLLTYSHHIPDLEAEDDRFIALAEEQGFKLMEKTALPGKHMWSEKLVDIFYCRLQFAG